jgi:hypothetical protein
VSVDRRGARFVVGHVSPL